MSPRRLSNPAFLTALAIMITAAVGMKAAIAYYGFYLRKLPVYAPEGRALRAIPTETAHWVRLGQDHVESAEALEVLGTDNYLTRTYQQRQPGPDGRKRTIQFHAAYYTGMVDTVPHVPERCLVGGGLSLVGGPWILPVPLTTDDWLPMADPIPGQEGRIYTTRLSNEYSTFGGGRRVNLPRDLTPDQPLSLRVSKYATPNGDATFIAGYVFVANGGWVSSAEGVRLLAFDLTADYAYYLKIQVGSTDISSPEELTSLAQSLLDDLLGELMTCIPDWPSVERGLWPPDNPRASKP